MKRSRLMRVDIDFDDFVKEMKIKMQRDQGKMVSGTDITRVIMLKLKKNK